MAWRLREQALPSRRLNASEQAAGVVDFLLEAIRAPMLPLLAFPPPPSSRRLADILEGCRLPVREFPENLKPFPSGDRVI